MGRVTASAEQLIIDAIATTLAPTSTPLLFRSMSGSLLTLSMTRTTLTPTLSVLGSTTSCRRECAPTGCILTCSLLANPNFNDNRTLIQVTFDENESYSVQNTVWTLLLGGALPSNLQGTNDSTFYTHYSMMSSVQNNWGLGSLGRQDANASVAAVWAFQANMTGYTNAPATGANVPMLNLTAVAPGPGNPTIWTPILAPQANAVGAGGGQVFFNNSATNMSMTSYTPINLTAMQAVNPLGINPNYTYSNPNLDVNISSPQAISASSMLAHPTSTSGAAASGSASAAPSSAAERTVQVGGLFGAFALGISLLL